MTSMARWGVLVLATAGIVVLAAASGCSQTRAPVVGETAPLPPGVALPEGFSPLAGHFDPDRPDDHYNGWPRYILSESDRMVMAYVPSQKVTMGGGTGPDEVPAREVVVSHFYMDIHEVTNAQFHWFLKQRDKNKCGCGQKGRYFEYFNPGQNNGHPVRNVSWWEARAYCCWTQKSLPTEAQWEAAARGDDRRIYPWGNAEQSETSHFLCNCQTDRARSDGYEYTAPAMSFAPGVSPFGIHQMAGNVAEWCADWYDPGRYAYPSEEDPGMGLQRGPKAFGDENYPNPIGKMLRESRVGPRVGDEKVVRGGSYADPIERCRVDSRSAARPDAQSARIGFRCVLNLPPETPKI